MIKKTFPERAVDKHCVVARASLMFLFLFVRIRKEYLGNSFLQRDGRYINDISDRQPC